MPSFDTVSEVDTHELTNAIDQANRELGNRFDFKGVDAKFELNGKEVSLSAPSDFQLKQLQEILTAKMASRKIDVKSLDFQEPDVNLSQARQAAILQQGLSTEVAKKIVKLIKNEKFKVQASIQGDKVRVTGKKRDDLQVVMAFLREAKLDLPLQFNNFRD